MSNNTEPEKDNGNKYYYPVFLSICAVGATVGASGWTVMRPGETAAEAVGRTGCLTLGEAVDLIAVELGTEPEKDNGNKCDCEGLRAALDESRDQIDRIRHENERLRYELDKARNPVRR